MKKLFTSDKFFLAMTLCGSVGPVAYLVVAGCLLGFGYVMTRLPLFIEALCVVFLYSSYKKHSKNVMKGLMGALLMTMLLAAINCFSALYSPAEYVFASIYLGVTAILFVSHYIINSDHHSKPGYIKLNQALCIVYALNILAWDSVGLFTSGNLLMIIGCLINIVSCVGVMASVVCVESRLDAYRLEREAAGWTEEKGYPENYVHEYKKK